MFKLTQIYRSITTSEIHNGRTTLFWKDIWLENELLCEKFPHLYSFVLNEDASVADMSSSHVPSHHFMLPLSVEAYDEREQILQTLASVDHTSELEDIRIFAWGNKQFTSAEYYNFIFSGLSTKDIYQKVWKSKAPPKLKVFVWLLIRDRLNTKDMIIRRQWNIEDGPYCVLCNSNILESRDHLFFDCGFARRCWDTINITWDNNPDICVRIATARGVFTVPCFMEIFSCVAWNIWKTRNDKIFRQMIPHWGRWNANFVADLLIHRHRVKESLILPLIESTRNYEL